MTDEEEVPAAGYGHWQAVLEVMRQHSGGAPHSPPLVWDRYRGRYVAGQLRTPYPNAWDFCPSPQALHPEPELDIPQLTRREEQVLHLMIHGRSTPEMAAELGISESCVRVYRATVMRLLRQHKD